MRRLVKILFIFALLFWAAAGLRHAQGRRDDAVPRAGTVAAASSNSSADVAVDVADSSFVLKNLTLTEATGSTILNGELISSKNQAFEEISFEVRAYDRDGRVLRGAETRTMFSVQRLKPATPASLNDGHGVWLQGIPMDSIARLEIIEADDRDDSLSSWTDWFAGHAQQRLEDSEIEE